MQFLEEAISNIQYKVLMDPTIRDFIKDQKLNLVELNEESALTEEQRKRIQNENQQKVYDILTLRDKQGKDVNDSKNREGRFRHNDYSIRNLMIRKFSDISGVSEQNQTALINLYAKIQDILGEVAVDQEETKEWKRSILDKIVPLIVEAEDIIHDELNGENQEDIIDTLPKVFRNIKGLDEGIDIRHYTNADEFILSSFDDVYTFASFSKRYNANDKSKHDIAARQFSKILFGNYFQNLKRERSSSFWSKLKIIQDELLEETPRARILSHEQTMVLQHISSWVEDADNELLKQFIDSS